MIKATAVPYVTPHMDHDGNIIVVRGKWRCTGCGHRLTVLGIKPKSTRSQPWWTWIPEWTDRRRARRG